MLADRRLAGTAAVTAQPGRDATTQPPRVTSVDVSAQLRDYQRAAVEAIVAGLAAGGRGQVVAACGTGKTLIGAAAAQRLCPTGLVVVTCPTLALTGQTMEVWARTGVSDMLAVCSDNDIGDPAALVWGVAVPVTTDPQVVCDWIRCTPASRQRLIAVTHVSAGRVGDGLAAADAVADLLIIDEAHHTAGRADKHAALVHQDQCLPARRRLYLTATPRIVTTRRPRSAAIR